MNSPALAHQVRALLITLGFRSTSIYPVPVDALHAVSYLCDALATVWQSAQLDDVVLKTRRSPRNPRLQEALDHLVGRGMLVPSSVQFSSEDQTVRFDAEYELNPLLCRDFIELVESSPEWRNDVLLTSELALATASLGRERISRTVFADASYSDPLLDYNSVIDLDPDQGSTSRTFAANARMAEIAMERLGHTLSPSELTSLYVRHLYPFTEGAD